MSGVTGAHLERIILIFTVIALVIVVAYGEFARQRNDREARARDAALAEEVAAARSEAKAAFTSLIPQNVVGKANASVYAIVVNDRLFGTAFVVDRENGVLVTAAHVADAIPFDKEGARIRIFNRLNGAAIAIKDVRLHAGFGAFRKLIEDFQPVRPHTPLLSPRILPLRDLAFDAALLTVDPIDPETGENRLGPDLPIAGEEDLLSLAPGSPIAVIGFPYDTLDDTFAAASATSRVERGVVSAMIAPLDNATAEGDPTVANLIIHRLSTAGGNSGSPIINAVGEVVGIHTHGIESLSGNADGAAQRADVIYDLMLTARDERRLNEIFIPAWTKILSFWRSARLVLPWSFYLERTDPEMAEKTLIADFDLSSPPPFAKTTVSLTFGDAVKEYILPAEDIALPLTGAAPGSDEKERSDKSVAPVRENGQAVFKVARAGEFAVSEFDINRANDNVIFAFDYSMRRQLGFCRLATYWRKKGETRLRIQPTRSSTELYFPAAPSAGIETYQLVFHRKKNCDPSSSAFDAGVLSWTPKEKDDPGLAANIAHVFFTPRDHEQFGPAPSRGADKISNFPKLRCFLSGQKDRETCERPRHIDVEVIVEQ